MFCSISGVVPTEPVVNSKSGQLYERRLIEKVIDVEGKDPVTGEETTVADLIAVKSKAAVPPRVSTQAGVPGLLSTLQNEWDAVMVETHTLRKHLDTVRQELSQALYQHDAACRVIARLMKERDAARSQLQVVMSRQAAGGGGAGGGAGAEGDVAMGDAEEEGEDAGLPPRVAAAMQKLASTLSKGRKKRPMPEGLASEQDIAGWAEKGSHSIHQSSRPGITCVDISPKDDDQTVTGGVDKIVRVFNRASGKVTSNLSGHTKKVTAVAYHSSGDRILSCSQDKTVRVWDASGSKFASNAVLKSHAAEVNGLSIHPTGDYVATASADSTWAFTDIESGKRFVSNDEAKSALESIMFHPDGLILATGTADNVVRIWDMAALNNVATFEGHEGAVNSVCFSENGYYMASGSDDHWVRLWDLRKLKCIKEHNMGAPVNSVRFDKSGKYLACAASGIKVLKAKEWKVLADVSAHKGAVTDVQFGSAARFLASTSMDKSLKFFE